ncbi:hypothetical protein [Stieleria neptunia]|uniref:hypothetical protein n=1 Tax=Stieleria neptunia TaxID=2527979 RepID=UPI0011A212EB|nr:hypothetical protein [Stieleria neptunia]
MNIAKWQLASLVPTSGEASPRPAQRWQARIARRRRLAVVVNCKLQNEHCKMAIGLPHADQWRGFAPAGAALAGENSEAAPVGRGGELQIAK